MNFVRTTEPYLNDIIRVAVRESRGSDPSTLSVGAGSVDASPVISSSDTVPDVDGYTTHIAYYDLDNYDDPRAVYGV